MADDFCAACGSPLSIGDYPFCPHGPSRGSITRDEIPGGLTLENVGPEPVTVYSHSERRALMAARGLREFVRHVPGSPHTSSWATMDRYTLDAATALVSRGATSTSTEDEHAALLRAARLETLTMTVRRGAVFSPADFGFHREDS